MRGLRRELDRFPKGHNAVYGFTHFAESLFLFVLLILQTERLHQESLHLAHRITSDNRGFQALVFKFLYCPRLALFMCFQGKDNIGILRRFRDGRRNLKIVNCPHQPVFTYTVGINAHRLAITRFLRWPFSLSRPFPPLGKLLDGRCDRFLNDFESVRLAQPDLGAGGPATKKCINDRSRIVINRKLVAISYFDQRIERRRRLPLEHGFLCAAPPRFLVAQRHGMDAAEQIRKCRVHQKIVQRLSVRSGNQLHTTFGNGSRCVRFGFGSDLVDNDDLRHVVLDSFDHHRVLEIGSRYLHPPACPNTGVRDIAISADFIRCVNDDDSFCELGRKHSRALS